MTKLRNHPSINRDGDPTPRPPIDEGDDERPLGRAVSIGLGFAALATVIGSQFIGESGGSDNLDKFGDPNRHIASVTLEGDARLRHDPFVADKKDNGSSNLVDTIEDGYAVPTPGGVFTAHDESGEWYGFTTDQLPGVDPDDDADGILWVNEQKVVITYKKD